jgi:hypothetical protein
LNAVPDLVVVTAASSNHFGALLQMLESLRRLDAVVECYDIGLNADEVRRLPRWAGVSHRTFDYASYPPFFHVSRNAGEYAWKPVIVAEVVDRLRAAGRSADVLWADAGGYFHAIDPIARRIRETGLWVRTSAGTMGQWTHPGMFERLGVRATEFAAKPNADATLVGLAVGSASADVRQALYDRIVVPWKQCALDKACIAPDGSSRANHRQDQAVLSYLVHRGGYAFAADSRQDIGVRTKCDRWFYHYIGFGVPPALYARTCIA